MRAAMRVMLGSLLVSASGQAGPATEALKARDAQIRKALPPAEQALTAAEKGKLEEVLTAAVDLPGMAKDALGKRYEKLSEADRKRYERAFAARFKKASEGEIDFYRSTEISYGAETQSAGTGTVGDVDVPTTLTLKGEPTPIVYTVRKEAAAYKIVDLSVDGVSTVENYRSSFGKIFDKEGLNGLVARLQKDPEKK